MDGIITSPGRRVSLAVSPGKAIVTGMLGSLFATAVMDILLIGMFWAGGLAPFTCFTIVGKTIAEIVSLNLPAGSIPLGMAAHYTIGPILGAFFAAAQRYHPSLRANTAKKAVLFAVLYAEVVSQPLLALPPVFLHMPVSVSLQWFGGSFVMHLIWGCIFGVVWHVKMNQPAVAVNEASD